MPPPAPEPAPPHAGPVDHIEQWASRHLAPDLPDLKRSAAWFLTFTQAHAVWAEKVTALAALLAEDADPAAAPAIAALAAAAQNALAELQRLTAGFTEEGVPGG